jgi:hypothetical protein
MFERDFLMNQSRFREAATAPGPLFFTDKQLLENV